MNFIDFITNFEHFLPILIQEYGAWVYAILFLIIFSENYFNILKSKIKNENPGKKIVGIFSAPSIHPQLEKNLNLNAKQENTGMLFIPCIDFANLLVSSGRDNLKNYFFEQLNKQLS